MNIPAGVFPFPRFPPKKTRAGAFVCLGSISRPFGSPIAAAARVFWGLRGSLNGVPVRVPLRCISALSRSGGGAPQSNLFSAIRNGGVSCSGASALRLARGHPAAPCTPAGPTRAAVFFIVLVWGPSPIFFLLLSGVGAGAPSRAVRLAGSLGCVSRLLCVLCLLGCWAWLLCLLGAPPLRFFWRFLSLFGLFSSTFAGFLSAYSCHFACIYQFFLVSLQ